MEEQISQPVLEKQIETVQPVLPPPTTKPSYLIPALLSSFITVGLMISGFLIYNSTKKAPGLSMVSPSPSAIVDESPSPSTAAFDQTDWKTYSNQDFEFKYPSNWTLGSNKKSLISDIAKLKVSMFTKDMVMYNECMKLSKSETKEDLMIKYYEYGNDGEMCTKDKGAKIPNREIWITKADGDGFQPGIIFEFNSSTYPDGESLFKSILSTFAFSGSKISASNMIHYVLKDKVSTIDYPKNWKLTDNTKQLDIYQDGKLQWSQDLTLEFLDYKIMSKNPIAWGPSVCIYPDSPEYKNGDVYGVEYATFTEFSNANQTYRRSLTSDPESEKQTWSICSKSGNSYGGVSGFGASSYVMPQSYDEPTLSVMDAILMSMKNNAK
jgi:hypothetical protein